MLEFPRNKYFSQFGIYYGERDGVPYVAHLTCRGKLYNIYAYIKNVFIQCSWKEYSILDSDTKFLLFGRALNAAVKLDPIDVVGKKYKVNNYLDDKHPPRDFYSHIKPEIEDAMTKTFTYDILFHNSEHQATLLRYGIKKSAQVRNNFFH